MRTKFNPDYAVHVGQFIKKALDAYDMKQAELAEKIDVPKSVINEIIKGKRNINAAFALKLEPVFEMPADYWMSLQTQFDIAVARAGTTILEDNDEEIEIGNKSVLDIAHWFINKAKSTATGICDYLTQLKLQKLLYFAQAISLKEHNRTLFSEPILRWDYGPVVGSIYREYKDFCDKPIVDAPTVNLDKTTERILELTYKKYGIYTANYLVTLTHNEKSWKDAEKNEVLSPLVIKQTYTG